MMQAIKFDYYSIGYQKMIGDFEITILAGRQ
jgi:hypothetical protein